MIRAECVFEARVAGARVDKVRQSKLTDVPQPLEGARVHQPDGERVHTNVIPQRIAKDFVH